MYVCICNAIREKELRAAARQAKCCAEEIYVSLGSAPQCRQCLEDAEDILAEERAAANLPASAPA